MDKPIEADHQRDHAEAKVLSKVGVKVAAQNWNACSPGCSGLKLGRLVEELT